MDGKQRETSRHLTEYFVEQALKRGKGVAQFLGWFEHRGQRAIRYLVLYQRQQGFVLWVQESYDEGTEESHGDIGEYTSIHEEDEIRYYFNTLEETLQFASSNYGANRERWVNESMVSDEYTDVFPNRPL